MVVISHGVNFKIRIYFFVAILAWTPTVLLKIITLHPDEMSVVPLCMQGQKSDRWVTDIDMVLPKLHWQAKSTVYTV